MLRPGDRVGIGVSGGADSVALLLLLDELRGELGVRLVVMHFNHQLRGADSDADESFVAQLAYSRGLEHIAGREDVAAVARARSWNLEDAARRLRYAFFASEVRAGRVTRVAVGHSADDQAETVLARLVRGTGPAGLASIYPVKGHIVRPLLQLRRSELRDYLAALGQLWREDASNLDLTRLRARLRHEVLPVLEQLQPAIVVHFGRLARMARQDESFWTALVAERITTLARFEDGRIGIRCGDLLGPASFLPGTAEDVQRALSQRLVRGLVARLPGQPRQLTALHVEQVLHLAAKSQSGQRIALPGAVAERSFEWIWLEPYSSDTRSETDANVSESNSVDSGAGTFERMVCLGQSGEDTTVAVPEIGRRIRLKVIDWFGEARETNQSVSQAADAELLRSPLILRSWRPGDCFRPQGRRRPVKLKEFLRERRISIRERRRWPVLTSAGQLVWAKGLPVAEEFSPGKTTRTGVLITEEAL
jgi:tRNA(Ile)-lysidine synthase